MKKIGKGFIIPSAAITIKPSQAKFYEYLDKPPEIGDVVYGTVNLIGEHSSLENAFGRIHMIHKRQKLCSFSAIDTLLITMKGLFLMK